MALHIFGGKTLGNFLCIWDVDCAWQPSPKNYHVQEQQDEIEIYHQFHVLLQEREENKFIRVTEADILYN